MIHDIISPLHLSNHLGWWTDGDIRRLLNSVYPCERWWNPDKKLLVLSAVEVASDSPIHGPEYHISITKQPQWGSPARCSMEEAQWVLLQFGLDGWEEDNHVPNGKARNFWRPVADHKVGMECPCKKTEHLIVEGDYEHRPLL